MSADIPASLAAQRHALQEQLRVQRQALAVELTAAGGAGGGGYPRSVTMRWLIREPELVGKLVGQVAGGRAAAAIPAVLLVVRLLRSAIVLR